MARKKRERGKRREIENEGDEKKYGLAGKGERGTKRENWGKGGIKKRKLKEE